MPEMKEMCTIVEGEHKGPEEKEYLVCLRSSYSDHWMICQGRRDTYEYIKECLFSDSCIDVDSSFVLVETHRLSDRRSLYKFVKYCQDMYDDNFDIDEYYYMDDSDDGDYEYSIDNGLSIDSDSRLSMQSIMDGEASAEEE